jgi:hypothetical protein
MKPTYPMSKKAKIQFWVVNLLDPTADSYYDEQATTSTHYVRTLEEAKALIEKHTISYMPKKPDSAIAALREAYKAWTPFDPYTGEPNDPLPEPPEFETLPLWTWVEKDGVCRTEVNEIAKKVDASEINTNWNDYTWEGDYAFGSAHLVTLE